MSGLKLTFMILLLVSLIILMVQNSQPVIFRFLHWNYSVSQLLLVLVVFVIGFLTGVLAAKWPARKPQNDA